MSTDDSRWRRARLIPTSGIGGIAEQEARATSALLAVIPAVSEFGASLLSRNFGAPRGRIETFTEVTFQHRSGTGVRPDGLIRVTRGKRAWVALVEVKTGRSSLQSEQIEHYLDVCRDEGFDAVVTISNQFAVEGQHPVTVNRQKLRSVKLHHMSWTAVLTEATLQHQHRGVSDPDQAWILGELVAYLEHEKSGVMHFDDMGPSWVEVRDGARAGTLNANSSAIADVVNRWDEFARYMGLRLGRELGTIVTRVLSREESSNPERRKIAAIRRLVDDSLLTCRIRVPDAAGDIYIEVDLKSRSLSMSTELAAPEDRGARARITWLVRQLPAYPDTTRVDVRFANTARTTSSLLQDLRGNPTIALKGMSGRMPRGFRVANVTDMGIKRASGTGSFVASTLNDLDNFYRNSVQGLRSWTPPAPRLPEELYEE